MESNITLQIEILQLFKININFKTKTIIQYYNQSIIEKNYIHEHSNHVQY